MSVRDWASLVLFLTVMALAMVQSALESVAACVPRRPAKAPKYVPRHGKTKALAMAGERS